MKVYKAGDDETARMVKEGKVFKLLREPGKGPGGLPVNADKETVRHGFEYSGAFTPA
jgi:hypothetical protein